MNRVLLRLLILLTLAREVEALDIRFTASPYQAFEGDEIRFSLMETTNSVLRQQVASWELRLDAPANAPIAQGVGGPAMEIAWFATSAKSPETCSACA